MAAPIWRSFPCDRRQLRLDTVLICGQSFRWREVKPGEWLGVIANKVWRLKQDDEHVYYQVYESTENRPAQSISHAEGSSKLKIKDREKHVSTCKLEGDTEDGSRDLEIVCKKEHTDGFTRRHTKQHRHRVSKVSYETDTKRSVRDSSVGLNTASCVSPDSTKVKVEKQDPDDSNPEYCSILRDYFQLDVDLESLYRQWCVSDAYFKKTAADFWGVRMLRQDPVENLFSFICSSNNHISRISGMVEKLCENYGSPVAIVDGKMYHSFPAISSLAVDGVEERLRELGFGYRAKFIATSARYITENHGEEWVASLRQRPYEEAKTELMKLCGVGAKVADCVCLMSLDKPGALPVDTHVWQFTARHYLPKLQSAKSVTDKLYQEIGDHFRKIWGEYAGWAHSVLFTAELRHMQSKKSTANQVKRDAPPVTKREDDTVRSQTKAKRSKIAQPKSSSVTRSRLK
ncbi:hypothetical protein BaRGS_00004226 [Batillaria attramentaria]|uniref:N-glycosylase/DNA lyase n=1 Tax=Batillaria attramentaria TaxID=370345 RepID=A0ABD0LYU5_9CAEN